MAVRDQREISVSEVGRRLRRRVSYLGSRVRTSEVERVSDLGSLVTTSKMEKVSEISYSNLSDILERVGVCMSVNCLSPSCQRGRPYIVWPSYRLTPARVSRNVGWLLDRVIVAILLIAVKSVSDITANRAVL